MRRTPKRDFLTGFASGGEYVGDVRILSLRLRALRCAAVLAPWLAFRTLAQPAAACYGAMAVAPDAGQSTAAALAGPFLAGERNGLPAVWQDGLLSVLDHLLPVQAHHPAAVTLYNGAALIGGWADAPNSDTNFPPTLPQPVIWLGAGGAETDVGQAAAEGTPLVGGAITSAFTIDLGGGALDAQMAGYVIDGGGMEHAALWDFSNGPQAAPALSLLPNGSRALSLFNLSVVGYLAGAPDQPQLWVDGQNTPLPLPAPAASHVGGRAASVGSRFIVGYTLLADGRTQHATVWDADGANPVDVHPAGFSTSAMTGTAGDYVVGTGVDTNGTPHVLLWTADALNQPTALDPVLGDDPVLTIGAPDLQPTAVDASGNVAFTAGDAPVQVGFYARNQGASLSELTVAQAKPRTLTVTGNVAPGCQAVSAYVALYQAGVLVATSSTQTVAAGSQSVTLTNTISGLLPQSVYYAQLKTDGAVTSFGPTTVLYTPGTNLPPYGTTNLTFFANTPLQLSVSDLLLAAVDPEGDAVMLGNLDPITPTMGGGQLVYNFGDPTITYTPGSSTQSDTLHIPLQDASGRSGDLMVNLTLYVPPPVLSCSLDPAGGTIHLSAQGVAGAFYLLEATYDLGGVIAWQYADSATADMSGVVTFSDTTLLSPFKMYRVVLP